MYFDERSAKRPEVTLPAKCRIGNFAAHLTISDLTHKGCRLSGLAMRARVGEKVIISPDGLQPITAHVAWTRMHQVGVQFERPLHPSVAEHLISLYPAASTETAPARPIRPVA